jgi:biopolymer transport protein ExbD
MKAANRPKPLVEAQMISLADIAFLVIFFFMMTASFMKDKVNVTLPALEKTGKTESAFNVSMDAAGKIYLDGEPAESPEALEGQLRTMIETGKTSKECEVRFKCDKTLTYKQYSPVLGAISNAGGVIAIMHDLRK